MIYLITTLQNTILTAEAAVLQGTIQINFTENYKQLFYVSLGDNYQQITNVVQQTGKLMNIKVCNAELVEDPVQCYQELERSKIVTIIINMPDESNNYTLCLANIVYQDSYFSNTQLDQYIDKHQLIFTYTANYFNKDNTFYGDCYTKDKQLIQFKADKKKQENQFITIKFDCSSVSKKNRNKCIEYIKQPMKGCHFVLSGQFGNQNIEYYSQFIKTKENSKNEL